MISSGILEFGVGDIAPQRQIGRSARIRNFIHIFFTKANFGMNIIIISRGILFIYL